MVDSELTFFRSPAWYMFLANIPDADSTIESAEDITAAATAPRPINDTAAGHRYCITSGRVYRSSPGGRLYDVALWYEVSFQSKIKFSNKIYKL